jgi:phosphate transport system substrate-binding protein
MNDEFLRRLRPAPRAAFVHELKGKLDRLPRTRSAGRGPAYLRTLLVALLIGGAAFAVTMISTQRGPLLARVSASFSHALPSPGNVAEVVTPAPSAEASESELTPVTPHAARRDSAPSAAGVASARQERSADNAAGAASGAPAIAGEPATQLVPGIVAAGEGVRSLEGAGGAFPDALYSEWSRQYRGITGVSVVYYAMGSGGGLTLLQNGSTTFASVDVPMRAGELNASGLFQFPMVAGGVVPVVNLAGVRPSQIRLDASTLARIYLGEITHWSDPPIRKLNPGIGLPGTRITLAFRMDDSASTRLFTDYLARSSALFKARYGVSTQIDVSPGAAVRGDDGMADLVARTDGTIGYVDYLYARQHGIESIRLINREGKAVSATPESLQSAVSHADWPGAPGFGASLTDLPGEQTWPMTSASFIVMRARASQYRVNRSHTAAAVQFFDWAYRSGSESALQLGYVAIPSSVANRVRESWAATLGKDAPADPGRR